MLLLYVFITLIFLIFLFKKKKNDWSFSHPPNPKITPFLGNLLILNKLDPLLQLAYHSLCQQLGKVFRVSIFGEWFAVISDFNHMKEVHNGKQAVDRGIPQTLNLLLSGRMRHDHGIIFNSGECWKETRRFVARTLKDIGLGKKTSESLILEETQAFIAEIKKLAVTNDGIVDVELLFNKVALNVVWHFSAGERYDYDDAKMEKLYGFVEAFSCLGGEILGRPLGTFPALRFFPPFRGAFNRAASGLEKCRDFLRESIQKHEDTLDVNNPRDFIDNFLIAGHKNPILSKENLLHTCFDLFIAGTDTVSKTAMFAIVMMMKNPEIQAKVHDEIMNATGDSEFVTLADKDNLPYTEATLNEVWRFCNVVPLPPPRRVSGGRLKVNDYEIPGGTVLFSNSYTVHMDQDYWKDPETFRPERFLNEKGQYKSDERNIPFGIGARRCLGETLARMENLLFFANLLKRFRLECVDGKMPEIRPTPAITSGPPPFKMKVIAM